MVGRQGEAMIKDPAALCSSGRGFEGIERGRERERGGQ